MAICKLCHKEKKLIKKSHIIPDFMYQGLYTDKHKIYKLSPSRYISGDKRVQMPSSGEYEGGLLCKKCDNVIMGQYEDYARRALYGGQLPSSESPRAAMFTTPAGIQYTLVKNLSYKKFKLFLLSILWRASISRRDLFKSVDLGPHEEIIRQMIWTGNPGSTEDYPILVLTYLTDTSAPEDLIAEPERLKDDQGTRYVFIIAGFIYVFHISKRNVPEFVLSNTINQKNEMNILNIPKGKGWPLLLQYFGVKC